MSEAEEITSVLTWTLMCPVRRSDRDAVMSAYEEAHDRLRDAETAYSGAVKRALLAEVAPSDSEPLYRPSPSGTLHDLGLLLIEVERWDRAVRQLRDAVEEADRRLRDTEEQYGC